MFRTLRNICSYVINLHNFSTPAYNAKIISTKPSPDLKNHCAASRRSPTGATNHQMCHKHCEKLLKTRTHTFCRFSTLIAGWFAHTPKVSMSKHSSQQRLSFPLENPAGALTRNRRAISCSRCLDVVAKCSPLPPLATRAIPNPRSKPSLRVLMGIIKLLFHHHRPVSHRRRATGME